MEDYEKLGQFYLGKEYEPDTGLSDRPLLYDSKDLTTHAVCVGMTGSGKTGLCLALIEEALIDRVPVLAIDPKGDLGNLLLTFPDLAPEDFRPWIDEGSAARAGMLPDEYAAETAARWKQGLADWGQTGERIGRLRETADMAIYTPGSAAGAPLTVLKSFNAPSDAVLQDEDALRERVTGCTSGLLALLGIDADPVRSREHILIANILDQSWRQKKNLDIGGLIVAIQSPPFEKVGVFDLETFYPQKSRLELAMTLNNLLASPSFQSWMTGEPLDIQRLLHTPEGRPRLSIVSIAHLSDAERMFFVTLLLNEVVSWVRAQEGTSTLRAVLYMDEVFGYFPPVANPPSKGPMLTLLKQARAFGLGVVLATQNPVDLDYKGLSNTGTWFLGRLQTERDKARVMEGLEGASAAAGAAFDRQRLASTLAGLESRVFLMNNVHEDHPVVFHTRWAMSYLRGPLSREHISQLMAPRKDRHAAESDKPAPTTSTTSSTASSAISSTTSSAPAAKDAELSEPPAPPRDVDAAFQHPPGLPADAPVRYRPALAGHIRLHFVRSTYGVDQWRDQRLWIELVEELEDEMWNEAAEFDPQSLQLESEPSANAVFEPLPDTLTSARRYASYGKRLKDFCYQNMEQSVWRCENPKMYSALGESEGDFRVRLQVAVHELRDQLVEKTRSKFASKMDTLRDRLEAAENSLSREQAQYDSAKLNAAVNVGSSLLGVLFGRKFSPRRVSSSARRATRTYEQQQDVKQAELKIEGLERDIAELSRELEEELEQLEFTWRADQLPLEELRVRPRKSDLDLRPFCVVWLASVVE